MVKQNKRKRLKSTKKKKLITQLTFSCSKSTLETLEKGVKYAQM